METISERRVRLFQHRHGAAKVISSILTTIGAVEAVSEGTAILGLSTVVVGLAIEKEQKDPTRFSSLMGLALICPSVISAFINRKNIVARTATEAFLLSLKVSCVFMLLRLLFMGRRLRQLGELKQPKEL